MVYVLCGKHDIYGLSKLSLRGFQCIGAISVDCISQYIMAKMLVRGA